jgi:CheY-like chemotaxis protein
LHTPILTRVLFSTEIQPVPYFHPIGVIAPQMAQFLTIQKCSKTSVKLFDGLYTDLTFNSMKILMTDDDSDDRLLALLEFKKLNAAHSIDFVTDGVELIEYLNARIAKNRELPDLILLDLNMPRKDGREALREIKSNPKLKQLDIIIFSTSTSEADKKYTLDLGAKSYIVKPNNQEQLTEIFSKICEDLVEKPGWQYSIVNSSL